MLNEVTANRLYNPVTLRSPLYWTIRTHSKPNEIIFELISLLNLPLVTAQRYLNKERDCGNSKDLIPTRTIIASK